MTIQEFVRGKYPNAVDRRYERSIKGFTGYNIIWDSPDCDKILGQGGDEQAAWNDAKKAIITRRKIISIKEARHGINQMIDDLLTNK